MNKILKPDGTMMMNSSSHQYHDLSHLLVKDLIGRGVHACCTWVAIAEPALPIAIIGPMCDGSVMMYLSQSTPDLAQLFSLAMNAVNSNRETLNSMDETNHPNHGDHVANNLGIVKNALQSQQSQSPSDALHYAAQRLSEQGQGSTAPQYAQGLQAAADQFQGQQNLSNNDVGLLLHSMLGSASQSQAGSQAGASGLQGMLGKFTGKSQQSTAGGNDLVSKLAPAAMEFMSAKASGAPTSSAAMQAAMRAVMGGNPLQASSPGGASGGLIAQSIMQSILGQ